MIDRMGELVKRSIDYTLILALAGLGILSTVIFLQGFSVYGFYLDSAVLTVLAPYAHLRTRCRRRWQSRSAVLTVLAPYAHGSRVAGFRSRQEGRHGTGADR